MRSLLHILLIFLTSANYTFGQCDLLIIDNAGSRSSNVIYRVSNDSLIVKALTDFGRTKVDYFSERFDAGQLRKIRKEIKRRSGDENTRYHNEANLDRYGEGFAPREIKCEYKHQDQRSQIRIFNCHLQQAEDLFEMLNKLVPEEIKIDYKKADFNTSCS